jgi:hypothetical protein
MQCIRSCRNARDPIGTPPRSIEQKKTGRIRFFFTFTVADRSDRQLSPQPLRILIMDTAVAYPVLAVLAGLLAMFIILWLLFRGCPRSQKRYIKGNRLRTSLLPTDGHTDGAFIQNELRDGEGARKGKRARGSSFRGSYEEVDEAANEDEELAKCILRRLSFLPLLGASLSVYVSCLSGRLP